MSDYNNPYRPPYNGEAGAPGDMPPYRQPAYQPLQYQPPRYAPQPLPPKNPWNPPIRRNANIVCFGLVLIFLLSFIIVPLYQVISGMFISGLNIKSQNWLSFIEMLGEVISFTVITGVPILILRPWIGIPARVAYPMRAPRATLLIPAIFVSLGAVVLGMLLSSFVAASMEGIFGLTPIMSDLPTPKGIPATVLYFISLTFIPSFLEEMLFRGLIMQSLRRFGDSFALAVSAILFAVAHQNLVQGPNALVLGFVIGYFVLRTGSLATGIIIHLVNNSLAIGIDLITQNMAAQESGTVSMVMLAFYAISGLAGLAYLVIRYDNLFRLAPSTYPVTQGKKFALFFISPLPIIYILISIAVICIQFERVYV